VKNINVSLDDELYRQLKLTMLEAGAESWQDFFRKIVSGEADVYFELVKVDGEDPSLHVVEFKLGDYLYRYEHGTITLLRSPRKRLAVGRRYGV